MQSLGHVLRISLLLLVLAFQPATSLQPQKPPLQPQPLQYRQHQARPLALQLQLEPQELQGPLHLPMYHSLSSKESGMCQASSGLGILSRGPLFLKATGTSAKVWQPIGHQHALFRQHRKQQMGVGAAAAARNVRAPHQATWRASTTQPRQARPPFQIRAPSQVSWPLGGWFAAKRRRA
jgi:hypothetical protein